MHTVSAWDALGDVPDDLRAWNPVYVAYARAHDAHPSVMLEADRVRYPGGVMLGFLRWVSRARERARAERPDVFSDGVIDLAGWIAFVFTCTHTEPPEAADMAERASTARRHTPPADS